MKKKALITGISGQDGSYLTEILLGKGYEVHGIIRRCSSFNTARIDHLYQDPHVLNQTLFLHYGDLSDANSLNSIVKKVRPDECYNLAAQSHVRVSFDKPEYTADITGVGVLRMLEALRNFAPECKFYQASSSELYGVPYETPQNELTRFHPRSPYGVAKQFGYGITVNHRESYDMHASNGILFNHETVSACMPMIYRTESGEIDIKPVSDIVGEVIDIDPTIERYQAGFPNKKIEVWDFNGWTEVTYASGYPHKPKTGNKKPKIINARNSVFMATADHEVIMHKREDTCVKDIKLGDSVNNIVDFPDGLKVGLISKKESYLLGMIVGDGSLTGNSLKITNSCPNIRSEIKDIWESLGGTTRYYPSKSGFTGEVVGCLTLNGKKDWIKKFDIYTVDKKKKVPKIIFNTTKENQMEFLKGYYAADGLKKGYGRSEFRNIKTNSASLAQGIIYLVHKLTGQEPTINVELSELWGEDHLYYSVNFNSNSNFAQNARNSFKKYEKVVELIKEGFSQRKICRETGISRGFIRKVQNGYVPTGIHHLKKPSNEVKKIIEKYEYEGWFFDLETKSSTFHCGVGMGHVHNSPRRGETFVTRKVTRAVANIKLQNQKCLYLGNMYSRRDWGYALDFCEGMWLMLQQEKPDDYVLATGETHSIKEFVNIAFELAEIDIKWEGEGEQEIAINKKTGDVVVQIDPRYYRPAEVDLLLGDYSKAKRVLGWEPKVKFNELVEIMYKADYDLLKNPQKYQRSYIEV